MKKIYYTIGDYVFYKFRLCIVTGVNEGIVLSLAEVGSKKVHNTIGYNDYIVPVGRGIFEEYSNAFFVLEYGCKTIPKFKEFHKWLVNECNNALDNPHKWNHYRKRLENFREKLEESLGEMSDKLLAEIK